MSVLRRPGGLQLRLLSGTRVTLPEMVRRHKVQLEAVFALSLSSIFLLGPRKNSALTQTSPTFSILASALAKLFPST